MVDIYVTGDVTLDQFVYLTGDNDHPPDVREAWVQAKEYVSVYSPGAAATVGDALREDSYDVVAPRPTRREPNVPTASSPYEAPSSIFVLARDDSAMTEKERLARVRGRWRIVRAICAPEVVNLATMVLKQRPRRPGKADLGLHEAVRKPLAIVDYNQWWRKSYTEFDPAGRIASDSRQAGAKELARLLAARPFVVRTHDPTLDDWQRVRRKARHDTVDGHRRIWFSPYQDLADGKLRISGTWSTIRSEIRAYFQRDKTLWADSMWLADLVVQVDHDGILWFQRGTNREVLYHFPGAQPGVFGLTRTRGVVGGGTLITTALARSLLKGGREALGEAIQDGLRWDRDLQILGYREPEDISLADRVGCRVVPCLSMFDERSGRVRLVECPNPGPPASAPSWTELRDVIGGKADERNRHVSLQLGELVVPREKHAAIVLEITRRLKDFVDDHGNPRDPDKGKVFSFAIFGGPGSGKSFFAKQIAAAVDPRNRLFETLTYNLSQFHDPQRLVGAFEQIRSIGVKGKVPLVLWDEFDTSLGGQSCGWLSRFLMPMQDTRFFDGDSELPLGTCVFVFIGGTFEDGEAFQSWALDERRGRILKAQEGRLLKGRDFHSRLVSTFTVPAIGPVVGEVDPGEGRWRRLVRAAILRNFLRKPKGLKDIAPDVLAFLLHTPLAHGPRSLQRIVEASALKKTRRFERHHLPGSDVLREHVGEDGAEQQECIRRVLEQVEDFDAEAFADKAPIVLQPESATDLLRALQHVDGALALIDEKDERLRERRKELLVLRKRLREHHDK